MSWKDKFLASSFPLEFEVENILLKNGFHIDGEFPYARNEKPAGNEHEFSIDILAHCYLQDKKTTTDYSATIHFLVECKYRNPSKVWIFSPDKNDCDFTPCGLSVIREFPEYTTYQYEEGIVPRFADQLPATMRACEFSINEGEGNSKDIRHAINQLRYALPEVICKNLQSRSTCHPDDCKPFFIVPILITNAQLGVLKDDITVEKVKNLDEITQAYNAIDCVDLFSPYAQHFESHATHVFGEFAGRYLLSFSKNRNFEKILAHKYPGAFSGQDLAARISLMGRGRYYYSQFLIASLASLPATISMIKDTINEAMETRKQVVFKEAN